MQALILAGGKGTRLRPLTVYTPKPVVPICNRPFLLYQIDTLRRAGITDITLSLSYQPFKIEQQLGDGSDFGVKLSYTVEPQPMGTAGAYKFAEDLIREPTVVFNGDIVTDLDLKADIRQHNERKATATIVLAPVENPSSYGVVETEEDGRVRRFLEKPKPEETNCCNINAGTYILDPKALDFIPAGENYSFEYGLFPDLLKRGERFYAHVPAGAYWIDIGTPARYLQVHHDILAGRVRGRPIGSATAAGAGATADEFPFGKAGAVSQASANSARQRRGEAAGGAAARKKKAATSNGPDQTFSSESGQSPSRHPDKALL